LLFLREPARREVEASAHAPVPHQLPANSGRGARFSGRCSLGQVAVVMADVAANVWAAPVLSRDFGLTAAAVRGLGRRPDVRHRRRGRSARRDLRPISGQKSRRRGGIADLGAVIAAGIGVPAATVPADAGVTSFAVALG
jgi:hypothetical protein